MTIPPMAGIVAVDVSTTERYPDAKAVAALLAAEPIAEPPFPLWITAQHVLPQLLGYLTPIEASMGNANQVNIGFGAEKPIGTAARCVEGFIPEEDRGQMVAIMNSVVADYAPEAELGEFLYEVMSPFTIARCSMTLRDYESHLVAFGAPTGLQTLRKRLGLPWWTL